MLSSEQLIAGEALKTVIGPAVAAVVAALLAARAPSLARRGAWPVGLGLAVGFAVGFFAIVGFTRFPPVNVLHWAPYLAVIAAFASLVGAIFGRKGALAAAALTVVVSLWLILKPVAGSLLSAAFAKWLLIAGLPWLLLILAWRWAVAGERRPEAGLTMVLAATAASLVSALDGTALIGQLGGVLAASCGALYLANLLIVKDRQGSVANAVFLILFGALLLNAYVYAEISWIGVLLAYLTALSILLVKAPFWPRLSGLKQSLALAAVGAIPLVIALVYLLGKAAGEADDYSY